MCTHTHTHTYIYIYIIYEGVRKKSEMEVERRGGEGGARKR
jgi:hypothetical protein